MNLIFKNFMNFTELYKQNVDRKGSKQVKNDN